MADSINAGQRLSRGVAIIASVEPESCADIHGETLYYGNDAHAGYTAADYRELHDLGWYSSEGSWAFTT